jgi:hypothetical protein
MYWDSTVVGPERREWLIAEARWPAETRRLEDSRRAGAATQVPSESSYRTRSIAGDDRGIVGVEFLSPQGLAFFGVHTVLDARTVRYGPE